MANGCVRRAVTQNYCSLHTHGPVCKASNCDRTEKTAGYCAAHYSRSQRGADMDAPIKRYKVPASRCSGSSCNNMAEVGGLCRGHYERRRKGLRLDTPLRPTRGMTIADRMKFYTNPPDENGCHIWAGGVNRDGYPQVSSGQQKCAALGAHRVAMEVALGGPLEKGTVVHHKCAVRRCVNPEHLQVIMPHENTAEMHQRKTYKSRIAELEAEVAALMEKLSADSPPKSRGTIDI